MTTASKLEARLAPRVRLLVRAGHIPAGCARVLALLAPRFQIRYIDAARAMEPRVFAAELARRGAVPPEEADSLRGAAEA